MEKKVFKIFFHFRLTGFEIFALDYFGFFMKKLKKTI